ncbi:hypothetical protein BKA69DRAFT_149332 [Paraphysoderma sedebokerense]|nr:hypothetical protein BKA69DRAFT_149332 [Paraphysoderma sedebokerense]
MQVSSKTDLFFENLKMAQAAAKLPTTSSPPPDVLTQQMLADFPPSIDDVVLITTPTTSIGLPSTSQAGQHIASLVVPQAHSRRSSYTDVQISAPSLSPLPGGNFSLSSTSDTSSNVSGFTPPTVLGAPPKSSLPSVRSSKASSPPPLASLAIPQSLSGNQKSNSLAPLASNSSASSSQPMSDEVIANLQRKRNCEASARYRRRKQQEAIELNRKVIQLSAEVSKLKDRVAFVEAQNVNMKRRLRGLGVDVDLEFPDHEGDEAGREVLDGK